MLLCVCHCNTICSVCMLPAVLMLIFDGTLLPTYMFLVCGIQKAMVEY